MDLQMDRGKKNAIIVAKTWIDSDAKLLRDKPFEKVIGFNSITQPDNYEAMKCTIVFYL